MIGKNNRNLAGDLIKWGKSIQKFEETKYKNPIIAQMLAEDGMDLQRELSQAIKVQSMNSAIQSLKDVEMFIEMTLSNYESADTLCSRRMLASDESALKDVHRYVVDYRERLEEYVANDD